MALSIVSQLEEIEKASLQAEAGGCCFMELGTLASKPKSVHYSRRLWWADREGLCSAQILQLRNSRASPLVLLQTTAKGKTCA